MAATDPGNATSDGLRDAADELLQLLVRHLGALAYLVAFTAAGFAVGWLLRRAFGLLSRRAPTAWRILVGKAFVAFTSVLGFSVGLSQAYDANLGTIAATFGLASLALGFGLQNTVANVAAGVSLSLDKPFEVGDRIQVGETWGDVVSIGLRSTRIHTTGGQTVSIPNAMLDTREVWNASHAGNALLRLELPIGISYASSIALAEEEALRVARRLPEVLAFPPPHVRVRSFGESSVDLELRCWIGRAQDKALVTDRLLRGTKDAFDAAGVHFPFPQRTVGRLEDMVPPAPTPERLRQAGPPQPIVLVCTRSRNSADQLAPAIATFASKVAAAIVVLHVRPIHLATDRSEGEDVLNTYLREAHAAGVSAQGRLAVGSLAEVVPRIAKEEGARLVLIGHGKDEPWGIWRRHEVQAIKRACPVPLLAMETRQLVRDEVTSYWKERFRSDGPK